MSTYNWGYNPLTKWDEPPSKETISQFQPCFLAQKKRDKFLANLENPIATNERISFYPSKMDLENGSYPAWEYTADTIEYAWRIFGGALEQKQLLACPTDLTKTRIWIPFMIPLMIKLICGISQGTRWKPGT